MSVQVNCISDRVRAFFPQVSKLPLFGPENIRTSHYGLFRMDTGAAFGPAVSSYFVPHTTDDVVALVEATEEVFGEAADVQLGFRDGHYLSIQPSRQYRLDAIDRDSVWPRLIVTARYGESFRASVGMYRDVCRNLGVLRQVHGTSVVLRHTSGLTGKMQELIADFSQLRHGWEALSARIRAMTQIEVNTARFLDTLYPQTPDATQSANTRHRHRTEAIIRRIMRERIELGVRNNSLQTVSAWEAYCGLSGFIQHDKTRKGRPGSFDRAILAMEDPVMGRVESLLLSMAA
ncbi:MAG: DUF932 domain-containing protein [Actinomycetota bacterium]